jgi:hypothetical protein
MALQRTIVWSCPSGNFQQEGDLEAGQVAIRAKNTSHIQPAWTSVTVDEFAAEIKSLADTHCSIPTATHWDNTAKTMEVVLTFADKSAADAYESAFQAYERQFLKAPTDTAWTFVSATDANI